MEEDSPFSWVNWYAGNYKQERPNLKVQPGCYIELLNSYY